jgi:hypothetical protein
MYFGYNDIFNRVHELLTKTYIHASTALLNKMASSIATGILFERGVTWESMISDTIITDRLSWMIEDDSLVAPNPAT